MSAHTSILQITVDDKTKVQASAALDALGLSLSEAIGLLLSRIAADRAFPLELKSPNAETRAAMSEADAIARAKGGRFASADTMFTSLEEAGRR